MPDLFLMLVIAFVVIVFGIALLAIGWLIKGKIKIPKVAPVDTLKKTEESHPKENS